MNSLQRILSVLCVFVVNPLFATSAATSTGAGVQISLAPCPSPAQISDRKAVIAIVIDPAIAIMPDGTYIIAHCIAGKNIDPANTPTQVFRSTDKGKTWTLLTTMPRLQGASFFTHNGVAYCFGTGYLKNTGKPWFVIRKSTDNGRTWTPGPTATTDAGAIAPGTTATPSIPVIHDNRVWIATSRRAVSADLTQDLMTPAAWKIHNNPQASIGSRPAYRNTWPSYNDQISVFWSENQVVASPQTGVVIMPKIQPRLVSKGTTVPHCAHIPHTSLQTIANANADIHFDPAASFVPLPGADKKFGATYDPATKKFYALTNTILHKFHAHMERKKPDLYQPNLTRNTATLYSSTDLVHWDLEKIFIHSDNVFHHAWQYFNFTFDGPDIIIASRTAFRTAADKHDPPRGHDSNLLTFHRISNYQNLVPVHILKIEKDAVNRYEITDYEPAPLGNFALGRQPRQPAAIARDPATRTTYIRQSDNQVFAYDQHGNLLGQVAAIPAGLTAGATLEVPQPKTGQRTWSQPGSGAWYDPRNWHYWNIPDTALETVTLGSAATQTAVLTIDRPTTLNALNFRSENPYIVEAGNITATNGTLYHAGSITLAANPATSELPAINNHQGSHTIQTPLILADPTSITLAAGATLAINAPLALNATATLNIDLAGQSPAVPPLGIATLNRANLAARLQIILSKPPVPLNVPLNLIRIGSLQNITPSDITITTLDGTPLPFACENGAIILIPATNPL